MKRQPEYVAWLEGQDRETKEALLYGNWFVTKQRENYFKRRWVQILAEPQYFGRRVRGFDLAGTLADEVNRSPDYTATVLLSKSKDSKYCIEHAHRFRALFHDVEKYILDLSRSEPDDITYVIPVDSGSAGKAYARALQQKIAETGRHVVLHPTGNKSKLIRFRPFASVCQAGVVSMVSASWNDWLFDEWEEFVGDGKTHEDSLDAAVSAFWALNNTQQLPTFILPDLSGPSNTFSVQVPSSGLALPHSGLSLPRH